MKKIQPTNFVLAFIIIISFIIFFRSLDNKETFEDQTEDKSLIALQDFTKFAIQGPPGEKGSKGNIGTAGPDGPSGPAGEKGSDLEGAISSSGKLWLGGYNTGSSGISRDNEVQLRLAGKFGQGANGSTDGWTTYKLKIEGYEGTQKNCLVYPIFCRDRDGNVDFYLKNRNRDNSKPLLYIAGDLQLESQTGECSIKSTGTLKIDCNDFKFNTKGSLILENNDYKGNRSNPDDILENIPSLIVNGITELNGKVKLGKLDDTGHKFNINKDELYIVGKLNQPAANETDITNKFSSMTNKRQIFNISDDIYFNSNVFIKKNCKILGSLQFGNIHLKGTGSVIKFTDAKGDDPIGTLKVKDLDVVGKITIGGWTIEAEKTSQEDNLVISKGSVQYIKLRSNNCDGPNPIGCVELAKQLTLRDNIYFKRANPSKVCNIWFGNLWRLACDSRSDNNGYIRMGRFKNTAEINLNPDSWKQQNPQTINTLCITPTSGKIVSESDIKVDDNIYKDSDRLKLPAGEPGKDGKDGKDGIDGINGLAGPQCNIGPTQQLSQVSRMGIGG